MVEKGYPMAGLTVYTEAEKETVRSGIPFADLRQKGIRKAAGKEKEKYTIL